MSATERKQLTKIVKSGAMPARTILCANILLLVDRNGKKPMTVQEAAVTFNTSTTIVQNIRTSSGEKGLEVTLNRKKVTTSPVEAKVIGDVEAHIIALGVRRASERLREVDTSSSRRQISKTWIHRFDLAYSGGSHSKTNGYKPYLKKC